MYNHFLPDLEDTLNLTVLIWPFDRCLDVKVTSMVTSALPEKKKCACDYIRSPLNEGGKGKPFPEIKILGR